MLLKEGLQDQEVELNKLTSMCEAWAVIKFLIFKYDSYE